MKKGESALTIIASIIFLAIIFLFFYALFTLSSLSKTDFIIKQVSLADVNVNLENYLRTPIRSTVLNYPQVRCDAQIDLMFVLDGSLSIVQSDDDFFLIKDFTKNLVGSFTIDTDSTRFGLVQFSTKSKLEQGLSDDVNAIINALDKMEQQREITTDISSGLILAQKELASNGRPNARHIIVLLSDGWQTEQGDPVKEVENIKKSGTEIFTIAAGGKIRGFFIPIIPVPGAIIDVASLIAEYEKMRGPGPNFEQLKSIASFPTGTHAFLISVDTLHDILNQLVSNMCPNAIKLQIEPQKKDELTIFDLIVNSYYNNDYRDLDKKTENIFNNVYDKEKCPLWNIKGEIDNKKFFEYESRFDIRKYTLNPSPRNLARLFTNKILITNSASLDISLPEKSKKAKITLTEGCLNE